MVEQTVNQLGRIAGLREGVDRLCDVRRRDAVDQVLLCRKERAHQVHRLDAHHLIRFALDESDEHLGQRLQRCAEAALQTARAVRPSFALPLLRREEDHQLVPVPGGRGVEDDRFGALGFHVHSDNRQVCGQSSILPRRGGDFVNSPPGKSRTPILPKALC